MNEYLYGADLEYTLTSINANNKSKLTLDVPDKFSVAIADLPLEYSFTPKIFVTNLNTFIRV